ncbi:MAG: lysophospholipid acyltransferase family protein [candidate division WOR-3 bacterium]
MSPKWFLSRLIARILAPVIGLKVIGAEKVKRTGPLIIASNHKSYLDPPLVGYATRRECFFMAKSGLFEVSKFFTWLIKFYNAFPITGLSTIKRAVHILNHGQALVIFPEGTRANGGEVLPFHPGVGYLARKCQAPVVPVYIENSRRPIIDLLMRRYRLKISFGDTLPPPARSSPREFDLTFANQIREAILKLSQEKD